MIDLYISSPSELWKVKVAGTAQFELALVEYTVYTLLATPSKTKHDNIGAVVINEPYSTQTCLKCTC